MAKEIAIENFYYAEIARFDENRVCECNWGFYVNPEKCEAFTVAFANKLLEWGTEKYKERFHKEVDFNYIKLKMGDNVGKYKRDKNRLVIYQDGLPVYENNNGEICKDPISLIDNPL